MILKRQTAFLKFLAILVVLILIAVVLSAVIILNRNWYNSVSNKPNTNNAIVTCGVECAGIGKDIMNRGGSVADSAVAVLICEGILCPQSSGLGGGFLATIYIKDEGKVVTLDAREVAPKKAFKEMFEGNPSGSETGGLAVAVPGELKGLWALHQKYGKLSWSELIQPNIELCRNGHKVSKYLSEVLKETEDDLKNEETLREIFINPSTNEAWIAGDVIKRPILADSLEIIAIEGANAMHNKNGSLLQKIVEDIKTFGGIIEADDLTDYSVRWSEPTSIELIGNLSLYSIPLPGSGAVLSFIINILKGYDLRDDSLSYHRTIEAFKFAYAKRTMLGDEESEFISDLIKNMSNLSYAEEIRLKINNVTTFNDVEYYGANFSVTEDHGTSHISILGANGDAISITSTINAFFGCKRRSPQTGIILNSEMDDFSVPDRDNIYDLPPSPSNMIEPGKRPLSSMVPSIVLDKEGNVRLIIGGAGGTIITTSVAFALLEHVFKGKSLEEAINMSRMHHQLLPMEIKCEEGFDPKIVEDLKVKFNHALNMVEKSDGFSALTAISNVSHIINAIYDRRRGGGSLVF